MQVSARDKSKLAVPIYVTLQNQIPFGKINNQKKKNCLTISLSDMLAFTWTIFNLDVHN